MSFRDTAGLTLIQNKTRCQDVFYGLHHTPRQTTVKAKTVLFYKKSFNFRNLLVHFLILKNLILNAQNKLYRLEKLYEGKKTHYKKILDFPARKQLYLIS